MKGDISADFHVPAKRFSGARAQAGRVLTDADFNVAFDVLDSTIEDLVRTLLCAAGSPDNGLKVLSATPVTLSTPDGAALNTYEFEVAPGTFVLGGKATVLNDTISSADQTDWLSLILTPSDLPPAPAAGRTDLVYLEQVERAVRSVEDRELQERALGAADTTTRLRPQLRLRVLNDVPPDCHLAGQALTETLRLGGHAVSDDRTEIKSAARLGIAFVNDGPGLDPCAPAGAAGYLGAENQTLKVMLTAPDRFVWAYDHGEPLYRVQINAAAGEIEFLTEPRDPKLYPLPQQVIEILPWDVLLPNAEKAAAPLGHFARLTGHYDPRNGHIAYDGTMSPAWQTWLNALPATMLGRDDDPPRFFYARIWQAPTTGAGPDQPTGAGLVLPETGVALHFAGTGIAGDYWTAALRPNAPETVQPWNLMIDPAAGEVPHAPPIGPRRFYMPLALITWPTTAGAQPVIDDCRNRFRRLCRIKSCCTYQVGDGNKSFGDFNTIQEAVGALPAHGGEICLLPGVHDGPIDLRGRRNIKIHGCGVRSRVEIAVDPRHPNRPGVWLDRAQSISFCDFAIAGTLVFAAGRPCADITFERLHILARQSAAIALLRANVVAIRACRIEGDVLSRALVAADIAGLLPLVFLAGTDLLIEGNQIGATPDQLFAGNQIGTTRSPLIEKNQIGSLQKGFNRNRVGLGGIQIGGKSRNVRIEDNRIEGGNGHGITLGSLRPTRDQPDDGVIIDFPPWLTIDEDGCIKFHPGETVTVPGQPSEGAPHSAGPIRDLRIRDNLISDHGGCGISVVRWFIPKAGDDSGTMDDIELDELEIDDNTIERCMQLNLAAALPIETAFNSGFGGIALSSATDIQIHNNQIRDCGGAGRSPICGIYIRYAERLRIRDNRISDNGRPASLSDPLLVGNIGGIVLSHVDGVEEQLGVKVREVPAAVITGNEVVSPEGRALELIGSGQMLVQGNTLTSHGNNVGGVLLMLFFALLTNRVAIGDKITSEQLEGQFRAAISEIGGSAVLILNTGIDRSLALIGMAASAYLDKGHPTSHLILDKGQADATINRKLPRGPVSFSDNMVTFDALSDAMTISLSSIAIISLDDVGMHDNHCSVDLLTDFVLADALVFGLVSCRVIGNRFSETLRLPTDNQTLNIPPTVFSAITFGLLNATEMNQGTYCFLILGAKKPRVIIDQLATGPRARLDTNRHLLDDEFCERFRSISSATGTG
jgi:Right handed beta helix region